MKIRNFITIFCVLLFFWLYSYHVLTTAWMCDDVMFTMRAVLNFVNGYGLVSNVGERVQSFTHPLWFFLLSFTYAVSKNLLLTPYYLSIFFSFLTFFLLGFYNRKNLTSLLICLIVLCYSKVYVDFSTSGLEAPLTNFLILLLVIIGETSYERASKKSLLLLILISSLIFLTRQDLILLIIPYVFYKIKKSKLPLKSILKLCILGTLPAILWEIFSIIYYGFPFPNTFYSKEFTGIPLLIYLKQGLRYLYNFSLFDPFSAFILIVSLLLIKRHDDFKSISIGMYLYILYIVYVGGDFMAGRFLTPVIFFGILKFNSIKIISFKKSALLVFFILMLGSIFDYTRGSKYSYKVDWRKDGINYERKIYFKNRNLKVALSEAKNSKEPIVWKYSGLKDVRIIKGKEAILGTSLGPDIYVLDIFTLNQALTARIPIIYSGSYPRRFVTGHIARRIPTGYVDSIINGKNIIRNKEIHDYYDHILRVTRGDIFSFERFKSIFYLNFVKRRLSKEVLAQDDY